ncbi:MAG: M56 family metallopeptidase [Holophaga sp.]|nr:M56 family metallopeptidase [Holophaga sp.]
MPWLIAAWVFGVSAMSLRLAGGWFWIQRFRWFGAETVDVQWQSRLQWLARDLGVKRPVRLMKSLAVEVPIVLGWLRPLILVPAALFTAMDPRALETILAHELAHVRRHDYLVNLLQSAMEVLLFFHPAAWWLSAQIRAERENCCDDIAVSLCGDPLLYARALTALEELRPELNSNLALAATGGTLMNRIRRILAPKLPPSPAARVGLIAALAVSVLGAASTFGLRQQETPKATEVKKDTHKEKKVAFVMVSKDEKTPRRVSIQMTGKVKIQPETTPSLLLEDGARIEVEGKDGEQNRSFIAERGPGGEKRTWKVEGKEVAPDAQAEAWLKKNLEATKKLRINITDSPSKEMRLTWTGEAGNTKHEKELEAQANRLEEMAKKIAEQHMAKGSSEADLARLRADLSKQAKEVATQARKLAASDALRNENIRMIMTDAKAAKHDHQLGEKIKKEIKKRIVVKQSGKDGQPLTVYMQEGGPDTITLDVETDGDGKHAIVKKHDINGSSEGVVVFRGRDGNPKTEIEALKKAIQKMQERVDKLQQEADKSTQAAPTK